MNKYPFYVLFVLCLLLVPHTASSQTELRGTVMTNLNVRTGPGIDFELLATIPARQPVFIEGRNTAGDWVIVQTEDEMLRGWVVSRYIDFAEGVSLVTIPVVEDVNPVLHSPTTTPSPTVEPPGPEAQTAPLEILVQRLENTPILYNAHTQQARDTFAAGQALGNRAHVFTTIGDSISTWQPFLRGFASGEYRLGEYTYLQETIDWFSEPLLPGASPHANSFYRIGYTTGSGLATGSLFDPIWVDPTICANSPIICEFEEVRPSVVIIYMVATDLVYRTPIEQYHSNVTRIVETAHDYGVIPILTTAAINPHYLGEDTIRFNNVILAIAEAHDVALINLWQAARYLPNNGVMANDPIHLSQGNGIENYSFDGPQDRLGTTLRNLLTLQMLNAIHTDAIYGSG